MVAVAVVQYAFKAGIDSAIKNACTPSPQPSWPPTSASAGSVCAALQQLRGGNGAGWKKR